MDPASPSTELRELEEVAARLAIPVRYEQGQMRGGLCRLGAAWQIIINADLAPEDKAELLAESLARTDFDRIYVAPRVRQILERFREQNC
jgi:hypothetical protein